ncbi:MAG: VOC family protein [Steroidobacteraceae bacterium]
MFKILGIDHVVLRIADRERSLGFYRDLLGLRIEREQTDIGLIQLRAGRSLIDLVPAGGKGAGAPNVDHFALEVQPFDERQLREHFTSHGVSILESGLRYGAGGEGLSIYVRDPDGNKVELKAAPAAQR